MNLRKITWLGVLASLAIAPMAWGQAPGLPGAGGLGGAGGAVAPAVGPATTAAPTAAPANLWSFLCPTDAQKASLKTCFCNSALGQMVSSAAVPMSAMSGGLMNNCCVQNSIANAIANNPSDSSEGAAARIKKDEEDAKARRNAVRYLGTVDCSRWPEAEAALKNALRTDRNECVRFEAALALRNGCCCTNSIIDALSNCVLGENKKDIFPIERSDRVRAAAADALARCPLVEKAIDIDIKEKIEKKVDARPIMDPKEYYKRVAELPREKVLADARAVLASVQQGGKAQPVSPSAGAAMVSAAPVPAIHQRSAGLAGLVANAFSGEAAASAPAQARQPFFAGLTKTLTGKQDNVIVTRPETAVPAPIHVAPAPPVVAPAPIVVAPVPPVVAPVREGKSAPPAVNVSMPARSEMKPVAPPMETTPVPMPESRPTLPPAEVPSSEPRESTGQVEIEVILMPATGSLPPVNPPAFPRR